MSEGEMARLMEEVEEKKKLITNIRNKPWRMKRRLTLLKEAQAFVDKFEGALGKGKGRKWYAYKVMMTKVGHKKRSLCCSVCLCFLCNFGLL